MYTQTETKTHMHGQDSPVLLVSNGSNQSRAVSLLACMLSSVCKRRLVEQDASAEQRVNKVRLTECQSKISLANAHVRRQQLGGRGKTVFIRTHHTHTCHTPDTPTHTYLFLLFIHLFMQYILSPFVGQ